MRFTSILKGIILEASKYQILLDKFTEPTIDKEGKKQKPKISKEDFYKIIEADPTTRLNNVDLSTADEKDMENIKAGKYTPWLIKWYLTPHDLEVTPDSRGYDAAVEEYKRTFIEDLSQLNNDLKKHDRFKARIQGEKDIMKMTPRELYNAVKDFSLEKTKASAEEKEKASQTFEHPGGEIIFRGDTWTLVKITDPGQLGRDAACFYGGYQKDTAEGETRWCTSSPGYENWFNRYIKEGPLYVIIQNKDVKYGQKSKLPATRYQFHFPSDQFQDASNHKIDVIGFLNGPAKELKEFFKSEFARGLTTMGGERLEIDGFNSGAVGKFIGLYGLDDLIDSIPDTIEVFTIRNPHGKVNITIPESISRFKNLKSIILSNCVDSLPDSICQLPKLNFLSVMNCPDLKSVPECIAGMDRLLMLNLMGSDNVVVPEAIKQRAIERRPGMWDFSSDDDDDDF